MGPPGKTATLGFFSDDPLIVPNGTTVDAYHSGKGSYLEQIGEPPGSLELWKVGSNGDVYVSGSKGQPTTLHADLTPGPGGEAVIKGAGKGVLITGAITPLEESITLPAVHVPYLPPSGSIAHKDTSPLVLPPGDAAYDALKVGSKSEVVMQGPATIAVGELKLGSNAELTIDPVGGAVVLFITSSFHSASTGLVSNTSADPSQFTMVLAGGPDSSIHFASTGEFHGTVFAPEGTVSTASGFELFGRMVARHLKLGSKSKLHFDMSFIDLTVVESEPSFETWQILELGDAPALNLLIDPFEVLGIGDKSLLPLPAEAHL